MDNWTLRLQKLMSLLGGAPEPFIKNIDTAIEGVGRPLPAPPKQLSMIDQLGGSLYGGGIQGPMSGSHYGPGARSGGGEGSGGGPGGPGGVRLVPGPLTQPPPVDTPGTPITSTPFRGSAVHTKGSSQSMGPNGPTPTPRPSMGEPPPNPSSMRVPKGGLLLSKNKDIIPEKSDPFKEATEPPSYLLRGEGEEPPPILLDDEDAAESLRSAVEGNTSPTPKAKPSPKKLTAQPPVEEAVPPVDTMPVDRFSVDLPEGPSQGPGPINMDVPEPTARELYTQHLKGQPRREGRDPKVWERIVAALGGGLAGLRDPRMGAQVASDFINRGFNKEMGDWEARGKGLKEQADMEASEETLNLRDKQIEVGYAEHLDKLGQRQQELALDEQKLREQIRIEQDKLAAGERRTDVLEQHYKALEANQRRQNDLRGEEVKIKQGLADIRRKTGESYSRLADARVQDLQTGGSQKVTRLSPNQQTDIELDAIDKAVAENPEWARFIIPDGQPGAGRINMKKSPPPELVNAAKRYMDEYRKGALGQFDVEPPPLLLDEDQ